MLSLMIPKAEIPKLSTVGVEVRINGQKQTIFRREDALTWTDQDGNLQVRPIHSTEDDGEGVSFLCGHLKKAIPSPFIDKAKYQELIVKAKAVIQMVLDEPSVLPEIKVILQRAKFIEDLPEHQRKAALEFTSTALMPNYSNNLIQVGFMGSVWTDTTFKGREVRIAINPYATSYRDAISIDEIED